MDVFSNTFCAGGTQLGNGTWAVFGGNKPVTTGGVDAQDDGNVYRDTDGGTAIRMITPDDSGKVEYTQGAQTFFVNQDTGGWLQMQSKRWYPSVETLGDGTSVVIGGDINGGYVNTKYQDNPTYEFFPPNGEQVTLPFLSETLPLNLYTLTWLMPSGKLFMQANRKSILYDLQTKETTNLPDMPYAARVYPASGATAMLPLTPRNNYTPTILFCGGSNNTNWGSDAGPGFNITAYPADSSCVRIAPEGDAVYQDDDWMLEGRSMGEFVLMPDGNIWMGNGVAMGTAGYGDQRYSVGTSYGQDPLYTPAMYYPERPAGKRWDRTNFVASPNERMYHSTAILLPDSSILIAGSNPNADFTNDQWRSRTDIERWYPPYANEPRPAYTGMPESISYGGDYFNITLNGSDVSAANNTRVVLHRNGFHTHALSFGQRMIELESTYTVDQNANTTTLHVSQIPGGATGPNLFQPGNAFFFVVVNGIPSIGEMVMVGNGQLGAQPTTDNAKLPTTSVIEKTPEPSKSEGSAAASPSETDAKNSAQGAIDASKKDNSGMALTPMAGSMLGAAGLIVASLLM